MFFQKYQYQPWWVTVLTPEGVKRLSEVSEGSIISTGKNWTRVAAMRYVGKFHTVGYVSQYGTFWGVKDALISCQGSGVFVTEAPYIDTFIQNRIDSMPIIQTIVLPEAHDMWSIVVEDKTHTYWTDNCRAIDNY